MPYAANNKLSTTPIEGGIEITPAEYADALQGVLEGKRISVEGGVLTVEFPPKPEPEPEPEPTPAEIRAAQVAAINAERDRRLAADFTFQGKAYQRDAVSVSRITGAATLAGFAMAQGAQPDDYNWHGGDAPFAWIASDNSLTLMDAQTCFAFGAECAAIETRIVFAAKALRDAETIPADYAKDKHWP